MKETLCEGDYESEKGGEEKREDRGQAGRRTRTQYSVLGHRHANSTLGRADPAHKQPPLLTRMSSGKIIIP